MESKPTRNSRPTSEQLDIYATVLAKTGRHNHACQAANISVNSMRSWTSPSHPRFDANLAEVREAAMVEFQEGIMGEVVKRAVDGVEVELHHKGELTGHTVTQRSDRLLLALAQAYVPAMRPKQEVVSTNVNVDASALDPENLTPEQLAALEVFMQALDTAQQKAPREAEVVDDGKEENKD